MSEKRCPLKTIAAAIDPDKMGDYEKESYNAQEFVSHEDCDAGCAWYVNTKCAVAIIAEKLNG